MNTIGQLAAILADVIDQSGQDAGLELIALNDGGAAIRIDADGEEWTIEAGKVLEVQHYANWREARENSDVPAKAPTMEIDHGGVPVEVGPSEAEQAKYDELLEREGETAAREYINGLIEARRAREESEKVNVGHGPEADGGPVIL